MKNLEIKQHFKQAIIQFSSYDFKTLKTLGKETSYSLSFHYCPKLPRVSFHSGQLAKITIISNQMQEMWQQGKP
jgi:hypothetical protein